MHDATEAGSRHELEQRLSHLKPEDVLRGFFFSGALERVRALGDPAALERCTEAAGGNRFMSFFSYPATSLVRLLYTAAWALGDSHGGFGGALRYLGRYVAMDYMRSSSGRALLMLGGKQPTRTVNSFPAAYRLALNHGSCTVRWTERSGGTVTLQCHSLPMEYLEGAVGGIFESNLLTNVKVVGRQVALGLSEIDVSW